MAELILVCAATPTEARAARKGIADAGLSSRFEVLETGMGLERARRALRARLASNKVARPGLVVSTGLAGAFSRGLELDTWINPAQVHLFDGDRKASFKALVLPGAKAVSLATSNDLVVDHARLEQRFSGLPSPLAVDMESGALAEVAAEFSIPFMAYRMISDTPDSPLPGFLTSIAAALGAQSRIVRLKLGVRGLGSAARDPGGIVRLVTKSAGWSQDLRKGWSREAVNILKTFGKVDSNSASP